MLESLSAESQMFYIMLALPTLFGITMLSEGIYKMARYESGWASVLVGCIFLGIVTFGYFYLRTLL